MKKSIFLLFAIAMVACNRPESIKISGNISGIQDSLLYIENTGPKGSQALDSVKINNSGNFSIKLRSEDPEFIRLGFSNKNYFSLLAEPGQKIELTASSHILAGNVIVTGSPGSELVQELDAQLAKTKQKLDSLIKEYKQISSLEHPDSLKLSEMELEYLGTKEDQRKYSINFILEHPGSLASYRAINQKYPDDSYVLNTVKDLQFYKILSDSLSAYYPESKYTEDLKNTFDTEYANYKGLKTRIMLENTPATTLDINLPTPQGDSISLSSLKGKYVLLSFWASWDKLSTEENLVFKKLHEKYHRKGFEIYQVSFDTSKEAWEKAIAFDELPWINVSELSYPDSKIISLFNVRSLPTNYFVDKDGTITARDLHGKSLKIKLEQVFGY